MVVMSCVVAVVVEVVVVVVVVVVVGVVPGGTGCTRRNSIKGGETMSQRDIPSAAASVARGWVRAWVLVWARELVRALAQVLGTAWARELVPAVHITSNMNIIQYRITTTTTTNECHTVGNGVGMGVGASVGLQLFCSAASPTFNSITALRPPRTNATK